MSKLVKRGYSAADAAAFMDRANESHNAQWKCDSYQGVAGGGYNLLATGIPIIGGELTIDSSDRIRRKLTLEVGAIGDWPATDPNGPLAPFGQFVKLYVRIDRREGGWFPWLQMLEGPIRSYTYERPSEICTIEVTDWSAAVDDYLHTKETSYVGLTLETAIVRMVNDALPFKVITRQVSDAAKTIQVLSFVSQAASSRWDQAQELADNRNHETFFAANGDLVIRRDRIDADDDDVIAGVGPDVGTRASPVATIRDEEGGNLVASTLTVSRDGGCNAVFYPLTRPAKKQDKSHPGTEGVHYTARATQASGPVKWGDEYGYQPAVFPKQVTKMTDEVKSTYDDRAKSRLRKRRGVLRQLDLDAVGLYWVEADDLVKLKIAGTSEDHYVSAITFDVSGQRPARLRCRQLNVVTT